MRGSRLPRLVTCAAIGLWLTGELVPVVASEKHPELKPRPGKPEPMLDGSPLAFADDF